MNLYIKKLIIIWTLIKKMLIKNIHKICITKIQEKRQKIKNVKK